jgi:hypothetical protein
MCYRFAPPPADPQLASLQRMVDDKARELAALEREALGSLADLPHLFPGQYKITREYRTERVDGREVLHVVSRVRPIELVSFGGDLVARDRLTGEYV